MDQRKYGIVSGIVGVAAFVGLGLWGLSEHAGRGAAETALTGSYQRAFYEALDGVQNVHVLLGKAKVAGSKGQLTTLFAQMQEEARSAQGSLTQLPVGDQAVAGTAKFLNQVRDFAGTMLDRTAAGNPPGESQKNTLTALYNQAGHLNGELRAAEAKTGRGRLYPSTLAAHTRAGLGRGNSTARDLASVDGQMQKYPRVDYGGPFADQPAAKPLSGPPTPAGQVPTIALKFLDAMPGVHYQAKAAGSVKGSVPSYRVQVSPVNSRADAASTVHVADKGSRVAWFLNPRTVAGGGWNVQRAQAKAVSFLNNRGMTHFVATYHRVAANRAIFSLVREVDGVKNYPQQVKVAVALDNGQVVGFEGTGYLKAMEVKPSNKVVLSPEQAGRLLGKTIGAGPGKLAVIPDGRGGALYAYEFSGREDGNTYLVYVNAQNGHEERILRVVDTGGGQLTI